MNKNEKKSYVLIATLILIICVVLGSLYYLLAMKPTEVSVDNDPQLPTQGNQDKPDEIDDISKLDIQIVDSNAYGFDDLDFNFIIAKVRVKADTNINVSLKNFKTSEGIVLDDVQGYVGILENKGYYLGKQNVWYELVSNSNNYSVNIFIPVINKDSKEITLYINDVEYKLNLNDLNSDKSLFTYASEDIISDGKTYQMQVSKAYEVTGDNFYREYDDGIKEEFSISSQERVYAFRLDIVSLWGDKVIVEDAYYIQKSGNVRYDAFPSIINGEKTENIIGKVVTNMTSGDILISVIGQDIKLEGTLKIKFSNSDSYIDVEVNL